MVNEIYLNLQTGEVSGEIGGVGVFELAQALREISFALDRAERRGESVTYIDYDEGKIFMG